MDRIDTHITEDCLTWHFISRKMFMTCIAYINFFIKWSHRTMQFCSKNAFFVFKWSNTALIKARMKHSATWNRGLALFADKIFNPYLNIFCSFYVSFCDFLVLVQGFSHICFLHIPFLVQDFPDSSFFIISFLLRIFLIFPFSILSSWLWISTTIFSSIHFLS